MSLTAQTIRTIFAALALCLAASLAPAQVNPQTEKKVGGSTVRGTVVYADTGRPLRYARISLVANTGEASFAEASDKRGEFVVGNVPAGRYVLMLDAPGVLKPEGFNSRTGPVIPQLKLSDRSDLYTEISVNGTDSVEVKVQAVRGGVITGRVLAEDDEPLANAEIKLLRRENDKWVPVKSTWSDSGEDAGLRRADASGVYRLAGLRAGDYLVRAAEPSIGDERIAGADEAYGDGSFMVAYHPSATRFKDAQAVTVIEGSEATSVDIRLPERAPHTLTGTVTFGPKNAPAGWVEIAIERKDEVGFPRTGVNGTTRADAQGKWRVPGLPPGDYQVRIGGSVRTEAGYITVPNKRIVVRIRDEAVTVLNTTLSPGAYVEGRVILNGKPLQDSYKLSPEVSPVDAKGDSSDKESGEVSDAASNWGSVRPQGDFYINGVPPGNYWFVMTTVATDYYVKSVTRKGVDLMQTPIKLAEGAGLEDVTVTLATDFARVEAQLKLPEGASKKSFADVVVVVAPANDVTWRFSLGPRILQPNAEGKISFTSAPGEYFIATLTPAQVKKLGAPVDKKYFEKDTDKFLKIKLRGGEKTKLLTLTVADK